MLVGLCAQWIVNVDVEKESNTCWKRQWVHNSIVARLKMHIPRYVFFETCLKPWLCKLQPLFLLLCECNWHSSICLNFLESKIMFCGNLIMFCCCWINFFFAFELTIGSLQLYCSFWEGSFWKGFSFQNFKSYAFCFVLSWFHWMYNQTSNYDISLSKGHVNLSEPFVVGSTLHGKLMFQVLVLGANGLIRATNAPLGDCF
jgi:hypothetical protein